MQCKDAIAAVSSLAADETPHRQRQAEHVATCLRCQAGVVRDRRVRKALATLRSARVAQERPNPKMLAGLLSTLDDIAERADKQAERARLAAYVGGAAAAGGLVIALAAGRLRPSVAMQTVHRLVG